MPAPFRIADNFWAPQYFGEIRILESLQVTPEERPWMERPPASPEPRPLLLHLGCNVLRTTHLAQLAVGVLRAMGFEFHGVAGPAYCCSVAHFRQGAAPSAHAYAGRTLRHLAPYGAEHVVMWCPSCIGHYDEVVTREHEVAFPYEHMTAFVARHLDRLRCSRRVERRVALHAHTSHPRQDEDTAWARTILGAIPGVELVEIPAIPELGRHCGPREIAAIGRPAWEAHVARLLDAAQGAGADTLATLYHACHRELCGEEMRRPLEIVNWIGLVGQALGIEAPDLYKRWRLMGDPHAVLGEAAARVPLPSLDPARVGEVVRRAFPRRPPA